VTDKEAEEIIRRLKMTKEEIRIEEVESILRHASPYEPGNLEIQRLLLELTRLKMIMKGRM